MEVLYGVLFWGLIIWLVYRETKKRKLWPDSIAKLLDKGFITKEQALNIADFEKEERIKKWVKQKLITKEQGNSILEGRKLLPQTKQEEKAFHISIMLAICYLALGCILLGIIAVIAANYHKIPPAIRAVTTLSGLIAVSLTCFYTYVKGKGRALELFIVAGIGLIGANIATVSQWFQLDGNPHDAVVMWLALSLCFILLSKKEFWGYVWYPAILLTSIDSTFGRDLWIFLCRYIPSPIAGAFGVITLYLLMHKIAPKHSFSKALKFYAIVVAVILAAAFDVRLTTERQMSLPILTNTDLVLRNVLALLVLAAYPIYEYRKSKLTVCAILGIIMIAVLSFLVQAPVLGMVMTLFLLSVLATYMVKRNDLKTFHGLIFLMFLRLVLAYFHLFSTLAKTGIGLIILGILILLGVLIYSKTKDKIIQYIRERF